MKTSKERLWSCEAIRYELENLSFSDIVRWVQREVNEVLERENKLLANIDGYAAYGEPIVVDEYLLEDMLEKDRCLSCPCERYCREHNESCAKAKIKFLKGEIKDCRNKYVDEENEK